MGRVSRGYQDPGIGYPGSRGPTRRGQLGSRETATEREETWGRSRAGARAERPRRRNRGETEVDQGQQRRWLEGIYEGWRRSATNGRSIVSPQREFASNEPGMAIAGFVPLRQYGW